MFVLLVTLIVAGQSPYSYIVEFSSEARCHDAEKAVIELYERNFPKPTLSYSILCLRKSS